jgi:hypothetical protein
MAGSLLKVENPEHSAIDVDSWRNYLLFCCRELHSVKVE